MNQARYQMEGKALGTSLGKWIGTVRYVMKVNHARLQVN
jgi:hypothetical protein